MGWHLEVMACSHPVGIVLQRTCGLLARSGKGYICHHCKFTMYHQCALQSNKVGGSYYMYIKKEGLHQFITFLHNQAYLSLYGNRQAQADQQMDQGNTSYSEALL